MQGKNQESIKNRISMSGEIGIEEPNNLMIETTITTALGKKSNNVGGSPTYQTTRDKKLNSPSNER